MSNVTDFPTPTAPPRPSAARVASALLLIGLGSTLLLATRLLHAGNWWTIFILLTAIGLMAGGLPGLLARHPALQVLGRLSLTGGLVVLSVGLLILFGVPWRVGWTLLLIVIGGLISANAITPFPAGSLRHAWASLLGWGGLTTILVGVTFLADRLGVIDLQAMFGASRWWSVFTLLPGLGVLAQGVALTAFKGRTTGTGALLVMGLVLIATAIGEYLGLSIRWSPPVVLIGLGLALLLPNLWAK